MLHALPPYLRHAAAVLCLLAGCLFAALTWGASHEWRQEEGYRWAELKSPAEGKTGFTFLSPLETGIAFTNFLSELEWASNRVLSSGSGVATGDFDNDGLTDVFFCGLATPNALFKNLGGWRFTNVTVSAGVQLAGNYFRAAVFADVNGDGWIDLLVSAVGRGVFCLLNDGHGRFTDATALAGFLNRYDVATLALADVDGDRTLDAYAATYRSEDIRDRGQATLYTINGKLTVPPALKDRFVIMNGTVLEYGEPDQLYLNDGRGRFTSVVWTNGWFFDETGQPVESPLDWGLGATFRDFNHDGAPDIYVCNDYWTPDRIWINDGRGRFRAASMLAWRSSSASSMGVDFADIDRDGFFDCLVVDMLSRDAHLRKRQIPAYAAESSMIGVNETRPQWMRNTLFRNRGDGTFEEIANLSGVAASEWSWQPLFLDVDLDGYEDLLLTTGHIKDVQDLDAVAEINARQHPWRGYPNEAARQKAFTEELMVHNRLFPELKTAIVAFRNSGNWKFEDATCLWGTDQPGVHHGIATADFDNDGDLDFVVNNLNGPAGVYRSESIQPRVAVRLRGLAPNTQGIGAKVTLVNGAVTRQMQEVIAGGRYLSGSEPMLVFAAGGTTNRMALEVAWRSGQRSIVQQVLANQIYEISEPPAAAAASPEVNTGSRPAAPLFEDVSDRLGHVHHEEPFDDFVRQSLLPRKLSQLGPGVTWFDVTGDGWDDLMVGSGRGGRLAIFVNDGNGAFKASPDWPTQQVVTRDQTTILGLRRGTGGTVLLAGSANYEDGLAVGAPVRQYDFSRAAIDDSLPSQTWSAGPLALCDFDGDGDLDLFVGGRVIAGRYPEPASSLLLRNVEGRWQLDAENTALLSKAGLVSAATWSDLQNDGFAELILACEWGPVRVFENRAGKLKETTTQWNLGQFTGWWNSVAAGDFDGDGKLDLIAGNWGLNSPYRASPERPLQIFFGDFLKRGAVEIIETEYNAATRSVEPLRMLDPMSRAMPFLRGAFPTHRAWSEATVAAVLNALPAKAEQLQVTTLASMLFLNRGDQFEARELPLEAQLAPVFGISVADFNNDGRDDVFLAQNFFATQPELPRLDAGRGLVLRGEGNGRWRALKAVESGIAVYGEQRGSAVADFDADGRVDLAVTQNGAATRLFRNSGAGEGVRLRLRGPAGNPLAIGASVQLDDGTGRGLVRELRAGSGYWSQDGVVPIVPTATTARRALIRWPGGRVTTCEIPSGVREVEIDFEGRTTKVR